MHVKMGKTMPVYINLFPTVHLQAPQNCIGRELKLEALGMHTYYYSIEWLAKSRTALKRTSDYAKIFR